jgi:hypothetical protein
MKKARHDRECSESEAPETGRISPRSEPTARLTTEEPLLGTLRTRIERLRLVEAERGDDGALSLMANEAVVSIHLSEDSPGADDPDDDPSES